MYQNAMSSMDSKPSGKVREVTCELANAAFSTRRRVEDRVTEVICADVKAPSSIVEVPSAIA